MAHRLSRFWHFIWHHRYITAFTIFLLIIGVIDNNSWLFRYEVRSHNKELQEKITELEQQCTRDSIALTKLASGQEAVEDIARVQLYMRSADEDVYIVVNGDSLQN